MPNMANIVVKDDTDMDFTWTAMSASPGDNGFAQWRGAGPTPALSPNLRAKTLWNGPRTARRVEISGDFPFYRDISGAPTFQQREPFRMEVTVPAGIPVTTALTNATVLGNTIAAALVTEIMATGYSAT